MFNRVSSVESSKGSMPSMDASREEAPKPQKEEKPKDAVKPRNKRTKKSTDMFTNEQKIDAAELVAGKLEPEVKVVKKDKGLIERTESSKIILTEDNRQVLND